MHRSGRILEDFLTLGTVVSVSGQREATQPPFSTVEYLQKHCLDIAIET